MSDVYSANREFERAYLPSQDKDPEPFVPGRDGQLVATIFYDPVNKKVRVERKV